jgi:hypothetical protein
LAEIADLSVTDASNTARFGEGQTIPTLNNGARALEGMIARQNRDRSAYTITTGSGTAYAILTNGTYPAHAAGMWFMVRAHVANTGAATLTVNALAAKPLRRQGGAALAPSDIKINQLLILAYNAAGDYYECIGIGDGAPVAPSYEVASLPTGASAGQMAYASNGRKNGEGGGSGTGVLTFYDGSEWRACDTGATVAA